MVEHKFSDGDISRGYRQNDPNAWHYLVRSYTPPVYRIAIRMLRKKQDAEAANQEVFIRVNRSINSHDPTRPLDPWLPKSLIMSASNGYPGEAGQQSGKTITSDNNRKGGIMKKAFIITVACICSFSVLFVANENLTADPGGVQKVELIKLWETKTDLKVPESVLYNPSEDILYISNINGKPTEKNGKGFISKVSLSGEILVLKWATGLNAPKGSGIYRDSLYVTDIDELVEIDLRTGKILSKYPAVGAGFLNDVTIDKDGNVYVSDMSSQNSVLYKLVQKKMTVWLKGPEVSRPNGLYVEKNKLILGNSGDGSLKEIDLETQKISIIAKIGSGIDGVRSDGKGNYFISDWGGKTSYVTSSGQVTVLMDTTDQKINSADIEYIESKQLLLIPTFFNNRVVAYKVGESK
jgi:sugar lactone lactonase YvrE